MATFTTNNSNNGNNDMSSPTSMNNNDNNNNNNNSPSSNDEGGSVVDIVVVDHKIVNTDREHLEFKLKVDISTGTYYDNNSEENYEDFVSIHIWKRWTDFYSLGRVLKKKFPTAKFDQLIKPQRNAMTTGKFDLRYVTIKKAAIHQFVQGLFDHQIIIASDEFVDFATHSGSTVSTPEAEATTLSAITKILGNEPFTELNLSAGCVQKISADIITAGEMCVWEFSSIKHDMGCSAQFKPSVANSSTQVVMPLSRYASQRKNIQLNWVSTVAGEITIVFDNSYSRFRSKVMKYRLKVISKEMADKAVAEVEEEAKLQAIENKKKKDSNATDGGDEKKDGSDLSGNEDEEEGIGDLIINLSNNNNNNNSQKKNERNSGLVLSSSDTNSSNYKTRNGSVTNRHNRAGSSVRRRRATRKRNSLAPGKMLNIINVVDDNDTNDNGDGNELDGSDDNKIVQIGTVKGFGKSKITTFTAKETKNARELEAWKQKVLEYENKYRAADIEIERLLQRNSELVSELDEAMDLARQRQTEVVRLESANVILCEESDNATEKMLAAEMRAEEAERLHEICLEETELHKNQIKELTEKLVQSIEDGNQNESDLKAKVKSLEEMVKKIENEPQILRETMAYERTLRLQAEAELIAAKNTASKWKHKHDDTMSKLGTMAERLTKVTNQKRILIKAIEKYRKAETNTERRNSIMKNDDLNHVVDNPDYNKEEAKGLSRNSPSPTTMPNEIVTDNSKNNGKEEVNIETDVNNNDNKVIVGNQVENNNNSDNDPPSTNAKKTPVTRRLSKTNPFAKSIEQEQNEIGKKLLHEDPSKQMKNVDNDNAKSPIRNVKASNSIGDRRRNTPIFGNEIFQKEDDKETTKTANTSPSTVNRRKSLTEHSDFLIKSATEQSESLINSVKSAISSINLVPSTKKVVKKSIDWGPLGTPEMSRLIQVEILKGNEANRRFVYNLWGHILDHKPVEDIRNILKSAGGLSIGKIRYSSAMKFLDVFIPHMRRQRPDMLFEAKWIDIKEKWNKKNGFKMWMEPMANKANGKHHLINVRISIERNDEYLTDEQVKKQSFSSGRYDD